MSLVLHNIIRQIDYFYQSKAPVDTCGAPTSKKSNDSLEKRLENLQDLVRKPAFTVNDLPAIFDALQNKDGNGIDDRLGLLEVGLVAMSRLRQYPISQKMQDAAVMLFYNALPHPPSTYLCLPPTILEPKKGLGHTKPLAKYVYRSADGTNYNPLYPALGKARSPYARTVPSKYISQRSLPEPGLVFDLLLKRDQYKEHPGGISSLFFAFANLITHSIFDTDHFDGRINNASSYLDLSVLYGSSEEQVDSVRRKDGTGRLWNDVFADFRLVHMPPACCALLVLLCRNHNFIAQRILDINENGSFKKSFDTVEEYMAQDDEIFHRARLVNCGYFMNIILKDYVGAILGFVQEGSDWRLDTFSQMRNKNHEPEPMGEGNVVSVEFNLLYRWHSALSEKDAQYTTNMFNEFFAGKDPKDVTMNDFKRAAHKHMIPKESVREWTFNNLKRNPDGRFDDGDIANVLHEGTEARARAFGARGVPSAMRIIEILGIQQARNWNTCSLNEFRKFFGLKPYANFKEWNPDPEIYKAAQSLYNDIDNLELYVGLQAEEAKPAGPGSGLCPGFTTARAILADAVSLSRGDRFFTVEFTPANLTSWGFQDCQVDSHDGSYGGLLTKLLFRTLPEHYPRGSAYAHFPLLTPDFMQRNMKNVNPDNVDKYSWSRPQRQPVALVKSCSAVGQVLSDNAFFSASDARILGLDSTVTAARMAQETGTVNEKETSLLTGFSEARREIFKIIMSSPEDLAAFFEERTRQLISTKSFAGADDSVKYIDIVKDVINLLPSHWISEEIAGLPLKSLTNPQGVWYEEDMYKMFLDIAEYCHLNFDAENDWKLREASASHYEQIAGHIKDQIERITSWFSFSDSFHHIGMSSDKSHEFLKKVVAALGQRFSHQEIAFHVFASVVPMAAVYSAALVHLVTFFMGEEKSKYQEDIDRIIGSQDGDDFDKLKAYIRGVLRLSPPVPGAYRTASREVVVGSQTIRPYETVYTSFTNCACEHRNLGQLDCDECSHFRIADHSLMSEEFLYATVPSVLRVIFEQAGIREQPSSLGRIASFNDVLHESPRKLYTNSRGTVSQLPDRLVVQLDFPSFEWCMVPSHCPDKE